MEITASKLLRTVLVLVSTNPLANRSQTVLKLVSLVSNLHRRTLLKPTRETLLLNSRRTVLKLVHRLPSANRRRTQLKLVSQKLGKRRKNVHKLVKLPLSNPLQTLPRNLLKPILSHRSYRRRTLPRNPLKGSRSSLRFRQTHKTSRRPQRRQHRRVSRQQRRETNRSEGLPVRPNPRSGKLHRQTHPQTNT